MFLPIGDSPNPKPYTPFITWGLIAANIAVYLVVTMPNAGEAMALHADSAGEFLRFLAVRGQRAMPSAYDLIVFDYGFRWAAFEVPDLLTSIFLHGGFGHLAGNMLFLWIYGDNIEHRLGRLNFLAAYLVGGICASLIYGSIAADPAIPLVGASGAISAVLGIYWILFPTNRIKFFALLFPFYIGTFEVSARWVLLFYLVVENLIPQLLGQASGVAYGAHLGGFALGVLIAFVVRRGSASRLRRL
jgi:membrane associated rhomboid family serine protease